MQSKQYGSETEDGRSSDESGRRVLGPLRSRTSKKLALDKSAENRDSQRTPDSVSVKEEEKSKRKKLEKFISENVRKAAIVTAEGR